MALIGCPPNVVCFGTLIDGLCQRGKMSFVLQLLKDIENEENKFGINCYPDLVTYNTIIIGICKDGLMEKAKQHLEILSM